MMNEGAEAIPDNFSEKRETRRSSRKEKSKAEVENSIFSSPLLLDAIYRAIPHMLSLRSVVDNPTMGALLAINYLLTGYFIWEWYIGEPLLLFHGALLSIMWLTSYFSQVSEMLAIGKGKAQAHILRSLQTTVKAKKMYDPYDKRRYEEVLSLDLSVGDYVYLTKGEVIPCDGEIVTGVALIDESAVTGESAPVVRESGGDISAVTGGTVVVSDELIMRVTNKPGEGFLAKMIQLVEGAKRRKTPNEEALSVLLTGCTIMFIIVVLSLKPMLDLREDQFRLGSAILHFDPFLVGTVFICLIPTTISGLLPAIGIAGMDRLMRLNIIAMSSNAIEAAGDADVLILDKTGTITLGNRQAAHLYPAPGVSEEELAYAACVSSLSDDTAEGKSIVRLAREKYPQMNARLDDSYIRIPFSAKTRMSGVGRENGEDVFLKGAIDAIENELKKRRQKDGGGAGDPFPEAVRKSVESISMRGGTPLVVIHNSMVMGAIFLKDIVKPGLKERFSRLRSMGIQTVMVTGDNTMTAAAIAAEAGVDRYFGQIDPEGKLDIIRDFQTQGHMVAMTGDGSNDAPALSQADVALAMNSGTQAAREAANLIDLDSNPTKLIEVVQVGKELLITRGALTTFSIVNDIAKYFIIVPALMASLSPSVAAKISIIPLSSPMNAYLAAGAFNAFILLLLIPIALRGVHQKVKEANAMFRANLCLWGSLGVISPFIGIKLLDFLLMALPLPW